jgi:hypothetical protein
MNAPEVGFVGQTDQSILNSEFKYIGIFPGAF